MSKTLYEISGYLKAFEILNDGNCEGCDYFIDEVDFGGNELITIEEYLMSRFNSDEEPLSLHYSRVDDWKSSLLNSLNLYFTRNLKVNNEKCKSSFIEMLDSYFNKRLIEVMGSGIESGYSSIAEYVGEISGTDYVFNLGDKLLILHFGIND